MRLMREAVFALACAGVMTVGVAAAGAASPTAGAVLRNAQGAEVGTATLTEVQGGVRIVLKAQGLPPGVHAMHLHAACKCEGPEFTSAGPHFNPDAKKHGRKNPAGPHAGDLPNIQVGQDGAVTVDVVASGVNLGEGSHSLLSGAGTSLVIHAKPDDEVSDPAGNAGTRIVCGPITR
ncbi:MAG TPA: superoxide dismutase family protein [Pantanalinema sp.]